MFHRPMSLAGSWYPRTAEGCLEHIRRWEEPDPAAGAGAAPARFCVAPHAGWMYSGRLAAQAVRAISAPSPRAAEPARIAVLLGGHLRRDDPVIAMDGGEWATPFGPFPIHSGFWRHLDGLPNVVRESPARHASDNSIEVLLPMLRRAFPQAELLPLRVPPAEVAIELGARLADYLAGSGLPAVAVASTDLTHYGPNYGFEPHGRGMAAERWVREQNDPQFIRALEAGSSRDILDTAKRQRNACCPGAAAALNEIVRAAAGRPHGFRTLAYATSLDAGREIEPGRPSPDFVGYVAGVYA